MTNNFSNRNYILISIIWLIVAVIFAIMLRSSYLYSFGSWFNYKFFLHTHSHIAILGWAFNAIYFFFLKQYNLVQYKKYYYLFLLLNFSVFGMLATFPFTGYALWSIVFSTLHIVLSYVFAFLFIRDTRKINAIHRKFAVASIFFMVLSTLGPLSFAPIITMGLKETIWYDLAIYFYLHFQYNGWFLLALFSLLAFIIPKKDKFNWNRAFTLMVTSTILNFSLSTLWTNPGWVINILSVLSTLMQIHAAILISKDIVVYLRGIEKFRASLLRIILILFCIKLFFALIGSIQEVAEFVYYRRNLVIGYLHLVFLGIVTPFLLLCLSKLNFEISKAFKTFILIFYLTFIINETLLTTTAFGFRGDTVLFLTDMIIYSTLLMGLILILLCLEILRRTRTTN